MSLSDAKTALTAAEEAIRDEISFQVTQPSRADFEFLRRCVDLAEAIHKLVHDVNSLSTSSSHRKQNDRTYPPQASEDAATLSFPMFCWKDGALYKIGKSNDSPTGLYIKHAPEKQVEDACQFILNQESFTSGDLAHSLRIPSTKTQVILGALMRSGLIEVAGRRGLYSINRDAPRSLSTWMLTLKKLNEGRKYIQ